MSKTVQLKAAGTGDQQVGVSYTDVNGEVKTSLRLDGENVADVVLTPEHPEVTVVLRYNEGDSSDSGEGNTGSENQE